MSKFAQARRRGTAREQVSGERAGPNLGSECDGGHPQINFFGGDTADATTLALERWTEGAWQEVGEEAFAVGHVHDAVADCPSAGTLDYRGRYNYVSGPPSAWSPVLPVSAALP